VLSQDALVALWLLMGALVGGVAAWFVFVIGLVNSSEEESDKKEE